MTLTIEIPDDLAARVTAAGIPSRELSRFAVAGISSAVVTGEEHLQNATVLQPRTGAELIKLLQSEDLLSGYGDPNVDAPELARELREKFSRRDSSQS